MGSAFAGSTQFFKHSQRNKPTIDMEKHQAQRCFIFDYFSNNVDSAKPFVFNSFAAATDDHTIRFDRRF
jgi:hypothetical protein